MSGLAQNEETPASGWGAVRQYFSDFKLLGDNPLEFWAVQAVNFLHSAAYFAILNIGSVFFSKNMGLSDVNAGYVMTVMTVGTTLLLLVSGSVTDSLGIKKSFLISLGIQGICWGGITAMGLMTWFPGRSWIAMLLFALMAPGMAMTITVFQAANNRFSSKRSRSASFSLWYLVMNLGAVASGPLIVDGVRLYLKLDNSFIFAIAFVCMLLSIAATMLLVRREVQTGEVESATLKTESKLSAIQILKTVLHQKPFWKLTVLLISVLGVRAIFAYAYLLMPKYWIRVIGPDVEIGLLSAINPICIVAGILLTLPIIGRFNIFKMLAFGAVVSSFSLFVLMLPYQWFGNDIASGYFNMSVVMMIVLSIGEILWSPRLNEYTAAIAPKGMEGTYLGMSMLPWFIAKTIVSVLSGHMLMRWCPEPPETNPLALQEKIASGTLDFWHSPEAMWFWLFLWALGGILVLIVFKGWLTAGADLDPADTKQEAAK